MNEVENPVEKMFERLWTACGDEMRTTLAREGGNGIQIAASMSFVTAIIDFIRVISEGIKELEAAEELTHEKVQHTLTLWLLAALSASEQLDAAEMVELAEKFCKNAGVSLPKEIAGAVAARH